MTPIDDITRNVQQLLTTAKGLHKRILQLEDQLKRKQRRVDHWRSIAEAQRRELTRLKGKK